MLLHWLQLLSHSFPPTNVFNSVLKLWFTILRFECSYQLDYSGLMWLKIFGVQWSTIKDSPKFFSFSCLLPGTVCQCIGHWLTLKINQNQKKPDTNTTFEKWLSNRFRNISSLELLLIFVAWKITMQVIQLIQDV